MKQKQEKRSWIMWATITAMMSNKKPVYMELFETKKLGKEYTKVSLKKVRVTEL
jgi:hypothetical protein